MNDGKKVPARALAALGIVFGDIGTSPLYTLQTAVNSAGGHLDRATVLGSLSLLAWTLLLITGVKYAIVVMRADNAGEGGILALMSLIGVRFGKRTLSRGTLLVAAGLFGAALLYGDGAITPAISVLSAVEGINVATKAFQPYVLPIAVAILLGVFAAQSLGTAAIGRAFGPVMLVWFVAIGGFGFAALLRHPDVLAGLDPLLGLAFLAHHGFGSFVILGAVFLSVTGAEALYADMSHVGRPAVRVSLLFVVLPALLLCYAGQSAFLLDHLGDKANPFFASLPPFAVVPMVILATVATVIASQAIITGSFTLTRQAIQLGWFPGLSIRQTSDTEYGQIYVPTVNWLLAIVTIGIAIMFGSSDKLSGAYGTAVSTTMLMTTCLLYEVVRHRWHWPVLVAGVVVACFGVVDLAFFVANLLKLPDGGYVPLLIGVGLFTIMVTWRRGIELVRAGLAPLGETSAAVLGQVNDGTLMRTPGSTVFLARPGSPIPPLVARHVAHFNSLPEETLILTVNFVDTPRVVDAERLSIRSLGPGLWSAEARFGFVEIPNLSALLARADDYGCTLDLDQALFITGDDEIVADPKHPKLAPWRRLLFGFLYRNAVRPPDRFALPRERLLEVGHQVPV